MEYCIQGCGSESGYNVSDPYPDYEKLRLWIRKINLATYLEDRKLIRVFLRIGSEYGLFRGLEPDPAFSKVRSGSVYSAILLYPRGRGTYYLYCIQNIGTSCEKKLKI